jgi:hypothetical protein
MHAGMPHAGKLESKRLQCMHATPQRRKMRNPSGLALSNFPTLGPDTPH